MEKLSRATLRSGRPRKEMMTTAEHAPESNGAPQGPVLSLWRKILGTCCIAIGIVGLALPVIQGVALIALGFVLLGKKEYLHVVVEYCRRQAKRFRFGKRRGKERGRDTETV